MAGTYQLLVEASNTTAVAMARTRVPVGAATAEAQADVNMGVTQPHGYEIRQRNYVGGSSISVGPGPDRSRSDRVDGRL